LTAIHGIARLDGQPPDPQDLAAMAGALSRWGPRPDPITVAGGRAVVTAAGRLDNHDELCDIFGVAAGERSATPDARLIASAFERWGEDAPLHLFGDWSFAAWEPGERRLVLARDHFGNTGLYYHHDGGRLAFASGLAGLLALPWVPRRLDELRLAQHLPAWPADGSGTIYEGIHRLPPAHVLTWDERGARTREYWRPENAPDVRLGSDAEYAERFVELFESAVRTRLDPGPVASTLSAGLDSSGVTGFAARQLARRDSRLTAYTSVPAHPEVAHAGDPLMVDEWEAAATLAAMHPNVDHVAVDAHAITPLKALERSEAIHHELAWAVANLPWILAICEDCRRRGTRVLLTGQSGNGGVSWAGRRGSLRTLVRRSREPGMSWPQAVRREVAGPERRRVVAEVQRRRVMRGDAITGPLIERSFAQRVGLRERIMAAGYDPTFARTDGAQMRLATLLPGLSPVGAIWHEIGAEFGLSVRDPTADVRLLEFCFGLPPDQFVHGNHDRWLMRRGLEGVAPESTRWNTRRGRQGADFAHRLRADAPAVEAAIARLEGSDLVASYLDLPALRERWDEVRATSTGTGLESAHLLGRGLQIGTFVLSFEDGS
jgi:asparagine synthase (glutamine-hydrolysing)